MSHHAPHPSMAVAGPTVQYQQNHNPHVPIQAHAQMNNHLPIHRPSIQQQTQQMSLVQPGDGMNSSTVPILPPASSIVPPNTAATASANHGPTSSNSANGTSDPNKPPQPSSSKKQISYAADRIIGTGSFGVVYQATVIETGETVAIKKVLQDRRFKNRELQIMSLLNHPNVIGLRHCFYSKGDTAKNADELYLNLCMDFIPSTLHRTLRDHSKANRLLPIFLTRLYVWQMCRAVHYIHSLSICHRDIKPQNLLLNPKTHEVRLCDFGSAKILNPAEPNVSYICSRYYRAPELVFEATQYTTAIDTWSVGTVFAELLIGSPLFPGDSSVDQMVEIVKVIGAPTKEDIHAMNPNDRGAFKFPSIQAQPWNKVFRGKAPQDAIDLIAQMLRYDPRTRIEPLDALAAPFFDPLRDPQAGTPEQTGMSKPIPLPPSLFAFTAEELDTMQKRGTLEKIRGSRTS